MNNLGEKIKFCRKEKGLTLKKLSDMTGLSVGFISNIERNQNSPSVSNLQQICAALSINLMEILQVNSDSSPVVKKDERKEIFSSNSDHTKIELLTKGSHKLNSIAITIDGNSDYSDLSWGHDYDEIGIVIKGALEIEVNNEIFNLTEGDSVYLEKFTPHKYRNPLKDPSIVYWFSVKK